jgi:phosphatidylinositol-3-phosphatase
MKLRGLAVTLALAVAMSAAQALAQQGERDKVPKLDHVFVIVLENHNSFTSFGSIGILDNPQAPQIQALADTYNVAPNYHGVWHPSLPNISR